MGYPGNKGVINLYPNIINELPPMVVFWELCAGHAHITKNMLPARFSAVVDKDNSLVLAAKNIYPRSTIALQGCVIDFLKELQHAGPSHVIYIDPPYLPEIVPNVKYLYKHIMSKADHVLMLSEAVKSTCRVAISHYPCELYDNMLIGWRRKLINVAYHGYPRSEAVYFNYPISPVLHDTRYTGKNKTERQQFKRMAARWVKKLETMHPQVKQLILTTIDRQISGRGS